MYHTAEPVMRWCKEHGRALTGTSLRVAEASGTLSFSQAQSLLGSAEPALRRCLAVALQESPDRTLRLKARIRVDLKEGAVGQVKVETEPPRLAASGCAQAVARPELTGTGGLTVVAELTRGAGMPGRVAPPPPASAAPIRPAAHKYQPPPEETDDE